MPLVQIHLREGRPRDYLRKLDDTVHESLVGSWQLQETDRFHIFHQHKADLWMFDSTCWLEDGDRRSDDLVVILITTSPRTIAQKNALFTSLPGLLEERLGLKRADVFVNVTQTNAEDWCLGTANMTLVRLAER